MEQKETNEQGKTQHFASKYFSEIDQASETEHYFFPVLKELKRHLDLSTADALDVGCGTGVFMKALLGLGCRSLTGVDGFSEFADRAVERGYQEVKIVEDLNDTALPFEASRFDLVLCKDVFEHLLNPVFALGEIRRVLKPGGLLLLHVPNHFPLSGRLRMLFTNNIDTFGFFKDESRWTFPHIRFYEYHDSVQVLKSNGFELVENLGFHFADVPVLNRFSFLAGLNRSLAKKYPNLFSGGYTLLVRKKA